MLIERLKTETQSLHRDIERAIDVLSADSTLGDYRDYLQALWGFQAPLERALQQLEWPAGFDLRRRLKAHLLASDLLELGVDADSLPRCTALPRVDTLSRALGCLYVTEGSTLGAQVIDRQLVKRLPEIQKAHAYLQGYEQRTGQMWRELGGALDAHVVDEAEAIDAARETFRTLMEWFVEMKSRRPLARN